MYTVWRDGCQGRVGRWARPIFANLDIRGKAVAADGPQRYRVWIVGISPEPSGASPGELSPRAIAQEPAEAESLSAGEACCYVGAFNRAMKERGKRFQAVAIPVQTGYLGDLSPGKEVAVGVSDT